MSCIDRLTPTNASGTQDKVGAAGELQSQSEDLLSVSAQRVGMAGGAPRRFRRQSRKTPAPIQKRLWPIIAVKRLTVLNRSPGTRLEIPALPAVSAPIEVRIGRVDC